MTHSTSESANFFKCSSCIRQIAPTDPRVRCLICREYDLCANCAIGGRFTNGHVFSHKTQVYNESGGGNEGRAPVLSENTIFYPQLPVPSVPSSTHNQGNNHAPPPLPPRTGSTSTSPNSSRWKLFFYPDMNPTPTFTTLLGDIFSRLDPTNSGYLVPEVYSRFLDDLDYLPHENACTYLLIHFLDTLFINFPS